MKTREDFIEMLGNEINVLKEKCASDEIKKEVFSESKDLLEIFLMKISDSSYDASQCCDCLNALEAICLVRLKKYESYPDVAAYTNDDASTDEQLHELKTSLKCLKRDWYEWFVSMAINDMSNKVTDSIMERQPIKERMDKYVPKLLALAESEDPDISNPIEENGDDYFVYDDNLGCDAANAKLLENLMGEFPEFDDLLRTELGECEHVKCYKRIHITLDD